MKKYPKIECTSTEVEEGWKSVAKTKVPCGVTIMAIQEGTSKSGNELSTLRLCQKQAWEHISQHRCGKVK